MGLEKSDILIAVCTLTAAPYLAAQIVFSDLGLANAVRDGSMLRASFYLAIGANPNDRNIPQKALESGNCAMIEKLQNNGADFDWPQSAAKLAALCPAHDR